MVGGRCEHGVLALETAQILREQDQDVALLVLLETINPERIRQQSQLARIIAAVHARMKFFGLEHKYLRSLPKEPANRCCGARPSRNPGARDTELTQSTPEEILYTAVSNYQPRAYDAPVLLIRSRRGILGLARDTHLGWDKTLGKELEVCESEGNHYTMFAGPNLERLAQKVREKLEHAERRWQQIGQTSQIA
jgi:thioesterase domain-containing protein